MPWGQGEHVCIIGMTGSGKTTLARSLLDRRGYSLMLVTKPDDLGWAGWKSVKKAVQVNALKGSRFRLAPTFESQASQFWLASEMAWNEGGWCIYYDETYYVVKQLGLEWPLVKLLTQGRSKSVSVVCGVQRPSWVPRFVFSEPTHIFCFQLGDKRDLNTIRDGVGDKFAELLPDLKRFEFAYIDKVRQIMRVGSVDDLDAVLA